MVALNPQLVEDIWFFLVVYSPLGAVGIWRWGVWGVKKMYARTYRPTTGHYEATVAVITPVYNEDPAVFTRALHSWRDNGVDEIIAVIDYTDKKCLDVFAAFSHNFPGARVIVTEKPGKRAALADGICAAHSDIVALVDSDTIWGEDVKKNALIPFKNPQIGGVSTRQSVLQPQTLSQRIFNAQLNLRYGEEMPFMVARGGVVVTCLSGRTAFYRRAAVRPLVDDLLHETFWGRPVISGDDKRLTYLVERAGWHVAFQQNAHVYTPGAATMRSFLKQRLRWTRNSWRADLRTLTEAWVWYHPRFVWYLLDRTVQPFALLLSPLFFIVSLYHGWWLVAAIQFIWWHVGRSIRMYPHLRRHPRDIGLLPLYVLINFYLNLIKIYALLTLNRQGWITRWDRSRLPLSPKLLWAGGSYVATALVVGVLASTVWAYQQQPLTAMVLRESNLITLPLWPASQVAVAGTVPTAPLERYEVVAGDTLTAITWRFSVSQSALLAANQALLPSRELIAPGMVLTIPRGDLPLATTPLTSEHDRLGQRRITYDQVSNTIEVSGRGQQVTLADIRRSVGGNYLTETAPGEWYVRANLHLRTGVTLRLDRPQVTWLKLASDPHGFVWLRATNGQIIIRGTKVTSWDATAGRVDEVLDDGRSYVLASHASRLDVYGAEIAYLGFKGQAEEDAEPTYGIAWKNPVITPERYLLTGEVVGTKFHHNYYGAYASGAYGMVWRNNEFFDNISYGLDLYGYTDYAVIERNVAHHNGRHGFIVAHHSTNNFLIANEAAANAVHGIMVHGQSDANWLQQNFVYDQQDGIVVYGSTDTTIQANQVANNQRGIRLTAAALRTVVVNNQLTGNGDYGIYLSEGADGNRLQGNTIQGSNYALYLKASANEIRGNVTTGGRVGVYLQAGTEANRVLENTLTVTRHGIYAKTSTPTNYAGGNRVEHLST